LRDGAVWWTGNPRARSLTQSPAAPDAAPCGGPAAEPPRALQASPSQVLSTEAPRRWAGDPFYESDCQVHSPFLHWRTDSQPQVNLRRVGRGAESWCGDAKGDSADFANVVVLTEAGEPQFYLRLIAAYRFFWFSEGA